MTELLIRDSSAGCVDITGFSAAGVHCDVRGKKDGRLDLAVVVSECPCTVAGVFTMNRMAAAPVQLGRQILAEGDYFKGFVANSGNANACTGEQGMTDALAMQKRVAAKIGCDPGEIFVSSTGRIGKHLPMGEILQGVDEAVESLSQDDAAGLRAADAILTSDTCRKVCTVEFKTDSGSGVISGMAKGAGMIEPNMATMLGFICTDIALGKEDAQQLLKECVDGSFNAITVDGDESTNDTVLLFANGSSGIFLEPGQPDWDSFKDALKVVCMDLAQKIVGDGEKITKVVEVCIEGAATDEEAKLAARAIANSLLVKSSWYGNDPNWGRLMDALGYSGASLSEKSVQLWYVASDCTDKVPVFSHGAVHHENGNQWKTIVSGSRFTIAIDLGQGSGGTRVWSTDLTEGYVDFNKSE
jgi:glutamate N-acetyltransferase/amino-acid N-acetyltransferase